MVNQKGKVIFVFSVSETLQRDLDDYNSGATVEAFRLAAAIKILKSQIHSMRRDKEEVRGGKKEED